MHLSFRPLRSIFAGLLPAVALVAGPGVPASAQSGPTVSYQADRVFRDDRGEQVKTTFYYTPQRQRLDFLVGTNRLITIVDKAANRIVTLDPRRKTKRTVPWQDPGWDFGLSKPGATFTQVGPEKVGDIVAIKFQAKGAPGGRQVFEGLAWLTSQRIVVRLDGTVRRGKTAKRFFMETQNLKIGEPNPRLFLVPPDYEEAKRQ